MNKVLIIGAGFAGLGALARLIKDKKDTQVTLIDQRTDHIFLPLLPDIVGRGISGEFLLSNLEDLSKRLGFRFINDKVRAVDLEKKSIRLGERSLDYDYLLLSAGSGTNFYGQEQIESNAYKLDTVEDAQRILAALKEDSYTVFVVAGGGYTGVEIATNLRIYFNKLKKEKRIVIVEVGPKLLGPLPGWMRDYVLENLQGLGIEVLVNSSVQRIAQEQVFLSTGKILNRAMLIWAAGVKTDDFIFSLNLAKTRQGRLKVDEYLRVNTGCFAAGDAAEFSFRERPLRMAVQFSIAQGRLAGANILRSIRRRPLKRYRPLDLGYIIPMANNQSCGTILGINMRGRLPTMFHYLMCIYRSFSFKNKAGIVKALLRGRV